jgi:hypothetical protein
MLKQGHGRESERRRRQHTTGPSPHHYARHGNSHHGHRHPKKYSNVNTHSAAQRKSPARKNQQAFSHDSSTSDVSESSAEESDNSPALKNQSAPEDESSDEPSDEETPSIRKGTLLNFEHRIHSKPPPKKDNRAKKEKKTTKNNTSQNDGKGVWKNVKRTAEEDARVVKKVVEEGVHKVESGIKKVEVYGEKTEKDCFKGHA